MDKRLRREKKKRFLTEAFSWMLIFPLMGLCFSSALAGEEPYPNRPINIIIAYVPGSVTDTQAKLLGDKLSEVLKQPFIRIHKAGAGGTIGASFAARAKPDGYTLFVATSGNLMLTPILKKVDYTWEDFVPLGIYAKGVINLYVKADAKWKTLSEFVEEAKKRPGQIKVSSFGRFTHADFVIEVFSRMAGIKLTHVPYKGCPEAMTALLGGHAEGDFCTSSLGQLAAGTVKTLATADYERSKIFPEVATFGEFGYPVALPTWYSLCVPQKTPQRVVDILSNAMKEIHKRHSAELNEAERRLEILPYFLDSKQSMQEFKRHYELIFKTAKELGAIEK